MDNLYGGKSPNPLMGAYYPYGKPAMSENMFHLFNTAKEPRPLSERFPPEPPRPEAAQPGIVPIEVKSGDIKDPRLLQIGTKLVIPIMK